MEKLPNGPFETEREARAAAHEVVRPEYGWSILSKPQNLLLLERAGETAGVKLGAYDQRILDWLSGFEDSMCAVVAGLVARAVAAARPGPHSVTFDLTSDHAEMYFVLTQALEDFAVRERDQAAWEEGNSSRERWADLADAMRPSRDRAERFPVRLMKLSLPPLPRLPRPRWPRRELRPVLPRSEPGLVLRVFRCAALTTISFIITAADSAAFAESYRGLWVWARHHGLSGFWAAAFPLQVDTFIVVGELALFVAMIDQWERRHKAGAWAVTLLGLAASVAGNIGHVAADDLQSRGTAAVPPVAAFAAMWIGLSVLKRVIARADETVPSDDEFVVDEPIARVPPLTVVSDVVSSQLPSDAETAAAAALRATLAAGNPLSLNQLQTRFRLTRREATEVRGLVLSKASGHSHLDAVYDGPELS